MDTILILILTAIIIGISAVLFKDKKKGGCASCPYDGACASKESCITAHERPEK